MAVKHIELKPGWLQRAFDDVAALQRGRQKIVDASNRARELGSARTTIPVEFTEVELHALAYMARHML